MNDSTATIYKLKNNHLSSMTYSVYNMVYYVRRLSQLLESRKLIENITGK